MLGFGMNGLALAVYWVGAALVESIALTDPAARLTMFTNVLVFSTYATYVVMSFMMLEMIFMLVPQAQVSAERINEVLDTKPHVVPGAKTEGSGTGTVEFRDVSFRYPGAAADELEHISFKVEKGQTLAIIGATGSGKTTLASLIPRFYDATAGTVLVDGLDVREYTFDALYNKLGYVTQKAVLFSGTVEDNVFSGRAQQKRRTRRCKPRFPCRRQRNSWTNTPKRPHIPSPSLAGTSPAGRSSGFPSRVRWQERRKF